MQILKSNGPRGIQHKRFNTTYHWPISPRLRRIILKQAGSARSQGAKGGHQWLDREDVFFSKKGHFHIGWLQESESVVQQFIGRVFCLLPLLFAFTPPRPWVDLNGFTLSHILLDARSQQLIGLQSQQVFFNKQPLGLENGLPGGRSNGAEFKGADLCQCLWFSA